MSVSQAYPVSKVLAEKAASAFAEEKNISLVTVCPVVTVGVAPATKVQTSVPLVLSLLSGEALNQLDYGGCRH
jgi:anthocyanidin reductase